MDWRGQRELPKANSSAVISYNHLLEDIKSVLKYFEYFTLTNPKLMLVMEVPDI